MPTNQTYPTVVLGIKNDNNKRARPQSGPQDADAVFEVLVEGGMTRFINVFYQSNTNYHGPVRSARPTDPTVLRPVNGVLVASGGTPGLIPESCVIEGNIMFDTNETVNSIYDDVNSIIHKLVKGDNDFTKKPPKLELFGKKSNPANIYSLGKGTEIIDTIKKAQKNF